MIRVGVVGVGGWGKNHLRVLSELGLLSGFCDTDLSKLDLYKKMYSVEGYSSVDELLSKAALDAVIVSTPTATHYAVAEKIINAGIAVFVEKPLSCTTIEGKKLVELAEVKNQLDKAGPTDLAFVHNVYFWLKDGITEEEEKAFLEGLVSLKDISAIGQFYYGPPAGTPRDVVDNSYDYALSIHFKDEAAQDAYQVDPIHTAFVEKLADHWTKVQVYDNTLMGE